MNKKFIASISIVLLTQTACNYKIPTNIPQTENGTNTVEYPKTPEERRQERIGRLGLFKDIQLFGNSSNTSNTSFFANKTTVPNQSYEYLWRASIDSIHFMHITTIDKHSGLIMTDWYQKDKTSKERYKVIIHLIDPNAQKSGVKVTAIKQMRNNSTANWIDSQDTATLSKSIETKILDKAHQLYQSEHA